MARPTINSLCKKTRRLQTVTWRLGKARTNKAVSVQSNIYHLTLNRLYTMPCDLHELDSKYSLEK